MPRKHHLSGVALVTCTAYIGLASIGFGQGPTAPPTVKVLLAGQVDVPLDTTAHVPVIEAKINGKGPYRFALDTNLGGMVEVTPTLAKELALPTKGEITVGDPSGRSPRSVHLLGVESMAVGSAQFTEVSVREGGGVNPGQTDDVIGLSLFRGLLVRVDCVRSRFVLREGSMTAKTGAAYTSEHAVPAVEINVNGAKMQVDLDSGNPAILSLPLSVANSLSLAAKPEIKGHGRTTDGEFEVLGATLRGQVHIGEVTLTNPALDFVPVFPTGQLGQGFLKNLVLTFDVRNQRVLFEQTSVPSPR